MSKMKTIKLIVSSTSMLFFLYYLQSVAFILLSKVYPNLGSVAIISLSDIRIHAIAFSLVTISTVLIYKPIEFSQKTIVVSLFAFFEAFISLLLFQQNIFNTEKLVFYDFVAIGYGCFIFIITFFFFNSYHSFLVSLSNQFSAEERELLNLGIEKKISCLKMLKSDNREVIKKLEQKKY